jgi:DNA-binding CsgD family transcriptional regulator
MYQRVCVVDPCRFTRSALTQFLQRRGMRVESFETRPDVLPGPDRWDWLIIFPEPGRSPSVVLHRPATAAITMGRGDLTLSSLLRILADSDDTGVPAITLPPSPPPVLTRRERDVLRALASGGGSREIAERLDISAKTVENHKSNIYAKLGVQSQAQAVAVAVRQGLIQEDRRGA